MTTLFQSETKFYRIPTAVTDPQTGRILVFAEQRDDFSDTGTINTVLRYSDDNGQTWSPIKQITNTTETLGNPTPIATKDTIYLLLTHNRATDSEDDIINGTSDVQQRIPYITTSTDHGLTWSSPSPLPNLTTPIWRWYATGPCNGIQLENGTLVAPANHSTVADKHYYAHLVLKPPPSSSAPHSSWTTYEFPTPVLGSNETTIAELIPNKVLVNSRSQNGTYRVNTIVDFTDPLRPITTPTESPSPSPVAICQASLIKHPFNNSLLISAPINLDRTDLRIFKLSSKSSPAFPIFTPIHQVFQGSSAYSNLIPSIDPECHHLIHIVYERDDYNKIVFETIDLFNRKPYEPWKTSDPKIHLTREQQTYLTDIFKFRHKDDRNIIIINDRKYLVHPTADPPRLHLLNKYEFVEQDINKAHIITLTLPQL